MPRTNRLTTLLRSPLLPARRVSIGPLSARCFSKSLRQLDQNDKKNTSPGLNEKHQGTFARTDREVQFEYPAEHDIPSSRLVQGRGQHYKRTLASFSLEGRVGVITGGARGLGLVMAQALVISGANVALVDLNRKSYHMILAHCFPSSSRD